MVFSAVGKNTEDFSAFYDCYKFIKGYLLIFVNLKFSKEKGFFFESC